MLNQSQDESKDQASQKGISASAGTNGANPNKPGTAAPTLVPIFTQALIKAMKEEKPEQPREPQPEEKKIVCAYESDFLDDVVEFWDEEVAEPNEAQIPQVHTGASQMLHDNAAGADAMSSSVDQHDEPTDAEDRMSGIAGYLSEWEPGKSNGHQEVIEAGKAANVEPASSLASAIGNHDDEDIIDSAQPASPHDAATEAVDHEAITDEVPSPELVAERLSEAAGTAQQAAPHDPSSPFFDIPEKVSEPTPEDTEDAPRQRVKERIVRRSSPIYILFNVASWCLLVVFFITMAFILLYFRYAYGRLFTQQESNRIVELTIQSGDTFSRIIERMRAEGLIGSYMGIDDKYLMLYMAHANENSDKIQFGTYRLTADMSLSDMYDRLVKGSNDYKITIPESKTAKEVAAIVKKKYPQFDDQRFLELTQDKLFIESLGLTVPSLEGYLYPNTYSYGPGMKEEELIKLMVNQFRQKVEPRLKDVIKTDTLSFHEHIILASLIEREARIDQDRPLIASVMFNRLKKKMPLQIDATVNFAIDDWSRPLTYEDLKVDSPYNTYKISGLPPGPICNPRLASIVATFEAPESDYLYYLHSGDGSHIFAKTHEEHVANKRKVKQGKLAAARADKEESAESNTSDKAVEGSAGSDKSKATATEEKATSSTPTSADKEAA